MIIFAGDIEANGSNVYLNIEELQQQLDTDFIKKGKMKVTSVFYLS